MHDSYISAPWILTQLRGTRGHAQAMSYWTYSDLFEEPSPPNAALHGGFGLMTRDGIRKPAWFAYKYLNALRGNEVPSADKTLLAARDGNKAAVVVWNWQHPEQPNQQWRLFRQAGPHAAAPTVTLNLRNVSAGTYRVQVRRTGHKVNDADTTYLEMGSPKDLNEGQLNKLHALTADKSEVDQVHRDAKQVKLRCGALGPFAFWLGLNDIEHRLQFIPGKTQFVAQAWFDRRTC
ncbi:GH39 family glycosyl hydrolase [Roseateles sp.]|uniref:GH39 family glycosyl hydrolase n=1 Tax=Roseateles sp. TaxID=1971397 RepID=UPI003267CCBF